MAINSTRKLVAQLAARMIFENGMHDYLAAKRKAAKQLGITESHDQPSNAEVEAALATHISLYHPEQQADLLRTLRLNAQQIMRTLTQFNPYLTGSVSNGVASQYSDIHIEVYADSEKEVEMHLLNQSIDYLQSQCLQWVRGNRRQAFPCFLLQQDATHPTVVTVLPSLLVRQRSQKQRMSLKQLNTLLGSNSQPFLL